MDFGDTRASANDFALEREGLIKESKPDLRYQSCNPLDFGSRLLIHIPMFFSTLHTVLSNAFQVHDAGIYFLTLEVFVLLCRSAAIASWQRAAYLKYAFPSDSQYPNFYRAYKNFCCCIFSF